MNLQAHDPGGERPLDPPENPRDEALWEQALELAREQAADASREGKWFESYMDAPACAALAEAWTSGDWTVMQRCIERLIEYDSAEVRAPQIVRELEGER